MLDICFEEAVLFLRGRVSFLVEGVGCGRGVVVVAPFGEMVCEFQAGGVGGGVFEVDYDELFVFVGGEEEGGFAGGFKAEEVAVLGLFQEWSVR